MKRQAANYRVLIACLGAVGVMLALVAFSLPIYRAFCEATGLGGTTRRADGMSQVTSDRTMTVRFNADVAPGLPWRFGPTQNSVQVHLGEHVLVTFWAENMSNETIVGHATYNVTPDLAGQYFNKIQCFCFDEESLAPHERVEMPVTFFVDPAILKNRDIGNLPPITLSYTFFRSTNPNDAKNLSRFGSTTVTAVLLPGDAQRGERVFAAHCAACHALNANHIGPMLGLLKNRVAGTIADFSYSTALKSSGITWNADSLDSWLQDPRSKVPGARMMVNLPDPQARSDIIAFLMKNTQTSALSLESDQLK